MYFANEIREASGYGRTDNIKRRPEKVKLAEQLVSTLSEKFCLEKYHNEFQQRLKQLIESLKKTGAAAKKTFRGKPAGPIFGPGRIRRLVEGVTRFVSAV
jgi:non-homologous end joining protein Ku